MDPIIEDLQKLNKISETLNRAVDVHSALNSALSDLISLMGLETGWIFLSDLSAVERQWGKGYVLAAHHNLPPGMAVDKYAPWNGGCDCQGLCTKGKLTEAFNEVRCSRLPDAEGDRRGLAVHASAPLRSGNKVLGILNVAADEWASFEPRALALLGNVGAQMGIALERAQYFDMLNERRINEQAVLLELSRQLLQRPALDELMNFLVSEVCRISDADASAVILPGNDPQTLDYCAAAGWKSDPVKAKRTTPADQSSSAGWVMHMQEPMRVEDLKKHSPIQWSPDWIQAENFRGHTALPLIVDERSIGALVMNNRSPRSVEKDEHRFYKLMANLVALAIENARLATEEVARQRLEDKLAVGREIQISLLPQSIPQQPGWEFAAKYQAARQVGGDFYDFIESAESKQRLGIVMADVSDKGVPAALFMAMSRTTIRAMALGNRSPSQTLEKANQLILKDSHADLFLAMFYGVLDMKNGSFQYANGVTLDRCTSAPRPAM